MLNDIIYKRYASIQPEIRDILWAYKRTENLQEAIDAIGYILDYIERTTKMNDDSLDDVVITGRGIKDHKVAFMKTLDIVGTIEEGFKSCPIEIANDIWNAAIEAAAKFHEQTILGRSEIRKLKK